jgi:hypothetical protein
MTLFLGILALLGGAMLVLRLTGAVLRLGLALAEVAATSGVAEIGARRGDLTVLADARRDHRIARRAALRHALAALLWLVVLLLPPLIGWTRHVYAAASVLWLLPRPATRPDRGGIRR